MRERHFPRVCPSCRAPMARQENACWRCGTQWTTEEAPRPKLRVIAGGATTDADRWTDEGGSVGSEAPAGAVVSQGAAGMSAYVEPPPE
jgi:DnaJ-class molecular chaperone